MSTTRSDVLDLTGNDQTTGYVLPKPGRGKSELVMPARPNARSSAMQRHREAEVARSIGTRVTALAQCQQQFLGELRSCLQEVEGTIGEAARVRLQGQVRAALSVLDWCDAVQTDLQNEGQWAERGLQPIELVGFCDDIAQLPASGGVSVQATGERSQVWWGHAGLLAETIQAGIALVAERTHGSGMVAVEVEVQRETASIRIAGSGAPSDEVDPAVVRVFRQAAERLGATVGPDVNGPGGAGFVLALPPARF